MILHELTERWIDKATRLRKHSNSTHSLRCTETKTHSVDVTEPIPELGQKIS